MSWTVTFYGDRVEAEISALLAGIVARFLRYAERIREEDGQDAAEGTRDHTAANEGY